ncbi:MAG: hypothetical protein K8J08_03210 [Thermoanaerobaculia bacterium]|nr:hypothetical protein [Thermoanaerobaculia bacterium]
MATSRWPTSARSSAWNLGGALDRREWRTKSLDEVERDNIFTVLRSMEDNREKAAGLLGLGPRPCIEG